MLMCYFPTDPKASDGCSSFLLLQSIEFLDRVSRLCVWEEVSFKDLARQIFCHTQQPFSKKASQPSSWPAYNQEENRGTAAVEVDLSPRQSSLNKEALLLSL